MKQGILLTITFLLVYDVYGNGYEGSEGTIRSSSPYFYQCDSLTAVRVGDKSFDKFYITQEFQKGLILNHRDRLKFNVAEHVGGKNKVIFHYRGVIESIPFESLAIGDSLRKGAASGEAYLIDQGMRYSYHCSTYDI